MKRFWTNAAAVSTDGGFAVALDGKPVHTPGRKLLVVRTKPLADAIADEWNATGETLDPRDMPLTGLANAAIERVSVNPEAFASGLARYGESDLTCYRAEGPRALVERQEDSWGSVLNWAGQRYGVDFRVTSGIVHVAQPQETVDRLGASVASLDPFTLAGLSPLVTIGGSLIAALAILEGAMAPDEAWEALTVDERWQSEQWGADPEGQAALDRRRRDFLAAARFLSLL